MHFEFLNFDKSKRIRGTESAQFEYLADILTLLVRMDIKTKIWNIFSNNLYHELWHLYFRLNFGISLPILIGANFALWVPNLKIITWEKKVDQFLRFYLTRLQTRSNSILSHESTFKFYYFSVSQCECQRCCQAKFSKQSIVLANIVAGYSLVWRSEVLSSVFLRPNA